MSDNIRKDILFTLIRLGIVSAASYFTMRWLLNNIDPTRKQKNKAQEKASKNLDQLGIGELTNTLNEYELTIASSLVNPEDIDVSWEDIAGLDDVIEELKCTVILPIKMPHLYSYSKLHEPPKGVLLYGPPGVGKTMVAKATAKEAGARFINLDISSLTDKWYGESQKLAAAVFTLAAKIQPCIIFIDEIDSFLRKRESHDHEATSMMKSQFMIFWDGLISAKNCSVIVMGATNRPQDLDAAIRRRMPSTFHIGLPTLEKRLKIIELILANEPLEKDVDLQVIALNCEGFSGSDLKELCRTAAMERIKEVQASAKGSKVDFNDYSATEIRPIKMSDFSLALAKLKRTKHGLGAVAGTYPLNRTIDDSEFVDNYNFD